MLDPTFAGDGRILDRGFKRYSFPGSIKMKIQWSQSSLWPTMSGGEEREFHCCHVLVGKLSEVKKDRKK